MASELYLIRKDGRFAKFSKVEAVELTSGMLEAVFTGSISTNVLTVTAVSSGTIRVGMSLTSSGTISDNTTIIAFETGTGGTGTYKVSTNQTRSSATLTGSGDTDSMMVWSSEYRDIGFTPTTGTTGFQDDGYLAVSPVYMEEGYQVSAAVSGLTPTNTPQMSPERAQARVPDNISHHPLRQSLLFRTHWQFDRGASSAPRYLYATWERGDVIADNPPSR
jgi:hypothetical protein